MTGPPEIPRFSAPLSYSRLPVGRTKPAGLTVIAVLSTLFGVIATLACGIAVVASTRHYLSVRAAVIPPGPIAPYPGECIGAQGLGGAERAQVIEGIVRALPPNTALSDVRKRTLDWFLADGGAALLHGTPPSAQAVHAFISDAGTLPGGPDGSLAGTCFVHFKDGGTLLIDDATVRYLPPGISNAIQPGSSQAIPSQGGFDPSRCYSLDGVYFAGPDGRWLWSSAAVSVSLESARQQMGQITPPQASVMAEKLRALSENFGKVQSPYTHEPPYPHHYESPDVTYRLLEGGTIESVLNVSNVLWVAPNGNSLTNPDRSAIDPKTLRPRPTATTAPLDRLSPATRLLDVIDDGIGCFMSLLLLAAGIACFGQARHGRRLHLLYVGLKFALAVFSTWVAFAALAEMTQEPFSKAASVGLLYLGAVAGLLLSLVYPIVLFFVFTSQSIRSYYQNLAGSLPIAASGGLRLDVNNNEARWRLARRYFAIVVGAFGVGLIVMHAFAAFAGSQWDHTIVGAFCRILGILVGAALGWVGFRIALRPSPQPVPVLAKEVV